MRAGSGGPVFFMACVCSPPLNHVREHWQRHGPVLEDSVVKLPQIKAGSERLLGALAQLENPDLSGRVREALPGSPIRLSTAAAISASVVPSRRAIRRSSRPSHVPYGRTAVRCI